MSSSKAKTASRFRLFYVLAKPGIIYANIISAAAGYLFAAELDIEITTLVGLIGGLALVIGGACAYNNYLDQEIDKKMSRTQTRGLVAGTITGREALVFATALTLSGISLLSLTQNILTVVLALIALIDYVVLYGIGKRRSVHGTLIGSVSGAIPLVAGYTAVNGRIDLTAVLLFVVMVAWQMAHFYGIALFRLKDYTRAGLPVMPAKYGERSTQLQIIAYIMLFIISVIALMFASNMSLIAGALLTLLGVVWLYKAIISYPGESGEVWGKGIFLVSLNVMLGMSLLLALSPLLSKIA